MKGTQVGWTSWRWLETEEPVFVCLSLNPVCVLLKMLPGDVELLTGIPAGLGVKLVPSIFPNHLQFLELVFTPGDATATVRTRKALDADELASVSSHTSPASWAAAMTTVA